MPKYFVTASLCPKPLPVLTSGPHRIGRHVPNDCWAPARQGGPNPLIEGVDTSKCGHGVATSPEKQNFPIRKNPDQTIM